MPTTPCPACGWPVEYEQGASTVGCPTITCRVSEFHPIARRVATAKEATHATS